MSTHYYFFDRPPCRNCGGEFPARHIGKSSAGWCFSLRVYPEDGIRDLDDWRRLFLAEGAYIEDEYGTRIGRDEMLSVIAEREWKRGEKPPIFYASWAVFYARNHAEPGPNGLARHCIDGVHCIGHGAGTWDLLAGEFS